MNTLHVICKIANTEYAIPATDIYQMESYAPLTPVPGTKNYMVGLVQIRQQVVPIMDTRVRFGFQKTEPTADTRFVILHFGSRLIGLQVDSAKEVHTFDDEDFKSPKALFGAETSGFVKSVAQLKDRIIMLLDTLKVAGEETANG